MINREGICEEINYQSVTFLFLLLHCLRLLPLVLLSYSSSLSVILLFLLLQYLRLLPHCYLPLPPPCITFLFLLTVLPSSSSSLRVTFLSLPQSYLPLPPPHSLYATPFCFFSDLHSFMSKIPSMTCIYA